MKRLIIGLLVLGSAAAYGQSVTGYYSHEVSGPFNKTCYYTSAYGEYTKMVRVTQLCPMTISVPSPY